MVLSPGVHRASSPHHPTQCGELGGLSGASACPMRPRSRCRFGTLEMRAGVGDSGSHRWLRLVTSGPPAGAAGPTPAAAAATRTRSPDGGIMMPLPRVPVGAWRGAGAAAGGRRDPTPQEPQRSHWQPASGTLSRTYGPRRAVRVDSEFGVGGSRLLRRTCGNEQSHHTQQSR